MSIHAGRRVITVGVDGSERALRAVRWGAAEAARSGSALRLVTAFEWLPERPDEHPVFHLDYREMLRGRAEAQLVTARAVAKRAAPGIVTESELMVGSPHAVLAAEARTAQLLVVGSPGHGRIEGVLAGSVGVAMASWASCPVVVVRGADRDARLPVLVGVDAGASSEAAIGFAFDAAASRDVELVAVHASRGVRDPAIDHEEAHACEAWLAGHLAGWARKYPQVPVRRVLARGRPAPRLLEWAGRAQLVVVGSRGRGELAGLVLGSVGNVLVHRSPSPVALVRG